MRRRFHGLGRMPSIGYGSNKRTKHMMPDGFYKFTVHNVKARLCLLWRFLCDLRPFTLVGA